MTDTIISRHLSKTTDGWDFTIGVYLMLTDETCRFLAADFDKESWPHDVTAFQRETNRPDVFMKYPG